MMTQGIICGQSPSVLMMFLSSYQLTVVGDEKVPLAAKACNHELILAIIILASGLLIYFSVVHLRICRGYQKRISELSEDKKVYLGWSREKLHDQLVELEDLKLEG